MGADSIVITYNIYIYYIPCTRQLGAISWTVILVPYYPIEVIDWTIEW